jgi:SAM-dependent methyltransferase
LSKRFEGNVSFLPALLCALHRSAGRNKIGVQRWQVHGVHKSSMRARNSIIVRAIIAWAALSPATAQEVTYLASPGAPARAFVRANRPVAEIVSPTRSTEAKRDATGEFQEVARLLGLRPGMTVGDIGAGSGYYTVRLAPLLGPLGTVIAQDVKRTYLQQLQTRVTGLKLVNVRLGLGEPHDPRLPPASLDAAILAHVYHEVSEPFAFLYNLAPALKPGAPVGIIDIDKPIKNHGTPLILLRCELRAVGYREVEFHPLPGDAGYLAIFEAPETSARPSPQQIKPCKAL